MFASTGLFQNLQCPQNSNGKCPRKNCIFSHRTDLSSPPALHIPVEQPRPTSASSSSSSSATPARTVVPAKRPVTQSPIRASATPLNASPLGEPPRKVQKLGSPQKSASVPSTSYTSVSSIALSHCICSPVLDWSSNPSSQCCPISSRGSRTPGTVYTLTCSIPSHNSTGDG